MLKKDLSALIKPLLPRCFDLAMSLLPDDLQAQQLVIDAFTQCMLKERSTWLQKEWDEEDKKYQMQLRRLFFKSMVKIMVDLAQRRSAQLPASYADAEVMKGFAPFFQLDIRARAVAWLRFRESFNVEEIERTLGMKRFEVIEKLHNSRFILMGQPPQWTSLKEEART